MSDLAKLRTEGKKLSDEIKAKQARLKEINAELVKGGAQKFEECLVVAESTTLGFPSDEKEQAVIRKMAGKDFGKIFDKVTTFKTVKSFKDVVEALFKANTAKAILERCSSTKSAYVKWL